MSETKSTPREVWVKVQDNAIHKVTICKETENGVFVEDWTGGIPIHYTVKAENILGEQAPDKRIKELEQGKRMHRVVVSKPIADDNGCFFVPNTAPTVKQLLGDEEVEQIVKDRDEYMIRNEVLNHAVTELLDTVCTVPAYSVVIAPRILWQGLLYKYELQVRNEYAEMQARKNKGERKQ